jgi:hypothetical protein
MFFGFVSKLIGKRFSVVIHNQRIGSRYRQKRKKHDHSSILKMSVNRVSAECHQLWVLHLV